MKSTKHENDLFHSPPLQHTPIHTPKYPYVYGDFYLSKGKGLWRVSPQMIAVPQPACTFSSMADGSPAKRM
jgi:hypothetical protein